MTLEPRLRTPIRLTDDEFEDLVAFVRDGFAAAPIAKK
jgi:hypothetical protein